MLTLTYMLYLQPIVATSLMFISMIVLFISEVLKKSFYSLLFALTSLTTLFSLIMFTYLILMPSESSSNIILLYLTLIFLNPLLAGASLIIRYKSVNYVIPYTIIVAGTSLTYLNISNALSTVTDIIKSVGVNSIYGKLLKYITSEYNIILSLTPASGVLLLGYAFFSLAILYGIKKVITQETINECNKLNYLGW